MSKIFISWEELKNLSVTKNIPLQFTEILEKYEVFIPESSLIYYTELWKDTGAVGGIDVSQNNINLADFENNYKGTANQPITPVTSDRLPKFLAAVSSDDVSMYISGNVALVNALSTVVDSNFSSDIQLQGMFVAVKGAEWGDTLDVEVGYANAQGVWTNLKTFASQVPMKDESGWQQYEYRNNAVSKIPSSLKIRARYNSISLLPKKLLLHYIVHK